MQCEWIADRRTGFGETYAGYTPKRRPYIRLPDQYKAYLAVYGETFFFLIAGSRSTYLAFKGPSLVLYEVVELRPASSSQYARSPCSTRSSSSPGQTWLR